MTLTIALPFALLILTVALALRLRRPRFVGYAPHCRTCGYDLTGNQSGQCPECGQDVAGANTVRGHHRRRPVLIALTIASLATCVFSFVRAGRLIDWYSYRPDRRVVKDAASADSNVARRAGAELSRRLKAGRLSNAAIADLTELALATHSKPHRAGGVLEDFLVGHLIDLYAAGRLSPVQADRFDRQEVSFTLAVRREVAVGDDLPIRVEQRTRAGGGFFSIRNTIATLNGRSLERNVIKTTTSRTDGATTAIRVAEPPGECPVTVEEDVTSMHLLDSNGRQVTLTHHVLLTAPVRIVAAGSPGLVQMVPRPDLTAQIANNVSASVGTDESGIFSVDLSTSPWTFTGNPLPVDLAFDVFARVRGKEHAVGQFTAKGNGYAGRAYVVDALRYVPSSTPVDLILRASTTAARTTPDIFKIWDGEVLLTDASWRR